MPPPQTAAEFYLFPICSAQYQAQLMSASKCPVGDRNLEHENCMRWRNGTSPTGRHAFLIVPLTAEVNKLKLSQILLHMT